MTLPTTFFGVFALLALLLPGVVHAAVRIRLQGYNAADRNLGERILQAASVSVFLDSVYLVFFGNWLAPLVKIGQGVVVKRPAEVGWALLLLGIVIPAIAGFIMYGQIPAISKLVKFVRTKAPKWLVNLTPKTGYNQAPTAWDWVAIQKGGRWVRILTGDGRWIGGFFSDESFVSTYPEPRDMYLAIQWIMSEDGKFLEPSVNSSGVWLSLEDAQLVEWTDPVDVDSEPTIEQLESK